MKLSQVVSVLLGGGAVNAANHHRAVANNNCGRAVAGTAKGSAFVSSAIADCSANVVSSYSIVYVTPPVSTATTTITSEVIASVPSTSVDITSTTVTSTSSETQTILATSTPLTTSTSVLTVTSGSPVVVTQYTPIAANVLLTKRAVAERAAASSMPAYASPCKGFTEYVAACSVAGVYGIATISSTLSASTVYITASATSTSTSILISTSTTTGTVSAVITETATTTSALTADVSTSLTSQTVFVPPPAQTVTLPMPNFKIKMTPLKINEPPLYMMKDPGDEQGLPATSDPSQATIWTIDIANQLVTADGNNIVTYRNSLASGRYYFSGNPVWLYLKYATTYQSPIQCSVNSVDLSLVCRTSTTQVGYLQYRNSLFKWMHYPAGNYNDKDQVSYPTYSATIVPV